jgi:hypothetical protein
MDVSNNPAHGALFSPVSQRSVQSIKTLIWIYFWLLMFEGSVRKWIPSLSTPFLLIRDPVAFLICFQAIRFNVIPSRYWGMFCFFAFPLTLLGLVQIIVAPIPPAVFLYGWRTYVLHVPVIIVAAVILDSEDLRKIGRWVLYLALPMTLLMCAQYVAPPDSWLNAGASEGSNQIGAALGHIRPAGTFSFITGSASFMQLVAAFVFLGITKRNIFPRWLVAIAGAALVASLPISGSRTLVLGVGIVVACVLIGSVVRGTLSFSVTAIPRVVAGFLTLVIAVIVIAQIPLVQSGITTFTTRWNDAAQSEGEGSGESAVEFRLAVTFVGIFNTAAEAPVLGDGIGLGSNFGQTYTGGQSLELGEGSWEREMNELGPLFGFSFLALRVAVAVAISIQSFRALRRDIVLPLYLIPSAAVAVLVGNLDQPTSQGFLTIMLFLCCAALSGDPIPETKYTL